MNRALLAGILLLCVFHAGCYTAAEMRDLAASKPDPRQEQIDSLWACVVEVAGEEEWDVEVVSRQGLLLATAWSPTGVDTRKRVRVSIIVVAVGVGINVNVGLQHRVGPEDPWVDVTDPVILTNKRLEETALATRIQMKWEERR
jgi:hypothetical protein